jgi:hypothetical protein
MTSLMTPSEEQARIVQAHHTGLSVGQIADNFHRSDMTIARILDAHGIVWRRRRESKPWQRQIAGVPSDEGDLLTEYRYCRWCLTRKPMDQYYWSDTRRRTRKRACNTCHRSRYQPTRAERPALRRRDNDGLTEGRYAELLARQDGRCAACQDVFRGSPHVDHSHRTGEVRGLLCGPCNTGLGQFRDDPARLRAAADYLGFNSFDWRHCVVPVVMETTEALWGSQDA